MNSALTVVAVFRVRLHVGDVPLQRARPLRECLVRARRRSERHRVPCGNVVSQLVGQESAEGEDVTMPKPLVVMVRDSGGAARASMPESMARGALHERKPSEVVECGFAGRLPRRPLHSTRPGSMR